MNASITAIAGGHFTKRYK